MSEKIKFWVLRWLLLAGVLFLSACDFSGGIYRGYTLEEMPLPRCIEKAIGHVPGVENVKYQQDSAEHTFTYDAQGTTIKLIIEPMAYGADYQHMSMRFNSVPPEETVRNAKSVIVRVDHELETGCHLKGLTLIEEYCPRGPGRGDKCP